MHTKCGSLLWPVLVASICVFLGGNVDCNYAKCVRDMVAHGGEQLQKISGSNFVPSEHPNEIEYFNVRRKIYDLDSQQSESHQQDWQAPALVSARPKEHGETEGTSKLMVGSGKDLFNRRAFVQHLKLEEQDKLERERMDRKIRKNKKGSIQNFLIGFNENIWGRLASLRTCLLGFEKNWSIQGNTFLELLTEAHQDIVGLKNAVGKDLKVVLSEFWGERIGERSAVKAYRDALVERYSRLVLLVLDEASSSYKLDMAGFKIPDNWFSALLADERSAVSHRTEALMALLSGDVAKAKISLDEATEAYEATQKSRKLLLACGITPPNTLSDLRYQEILKKWKNVMELDNGLPSFDEFVTEFEKLSNERQQLERPWNSIGRKPFVFNTNHRFDPEQTSREGVTQEAVEAFKHAQEARIGLRANDRVTALRESLLAKKLNGLLLNRQTMWSQPKLELTKEPSYIEIIEASRIGSKNKASDSRGERASRD